MRFNTLFFDLDDTLYPSGNGLWDAIRQRMVLYMVERMGISPEETDRLRPLYYHTYGTTLRGLQKHHQIDADDYLAYVHDLPLEQYIQPAPDLRLLLLSLPQSRWIFTNADIDHARRVLAVLRLTECFTGIADLRANGFACKPEPEAYQRAMALAGETDPSLCVMLDDSPTNLAPARGLGFTTVLVGTNAPPHDAADYTVSSLLELPRKLPELWQAVRE